tara:strand:+ start:19911 stop:20285 length:375 start_codon:yes stop_codon:yes gene_type:complete
MTEFGGSEKQKFGVTPGLDPGVHGRRNGVMSYYVYILASRRNGTLYIGVTNDIARRVHEHRTGAGSAFARKYDVHRLVHVDVFEEATLAIQREKTLKEWKRQWKIDLIEKDNPEWRDLYAELNF